MGRLFESGGGERTGRLFHCEEKRDEILGTCSNKHAKKTASNRVKARIDIVCACQIERIFQLVIRTTNRVRGVEGGRSQNVE